MKKQTRKIALATAGALMLSVVLTFTLILPAEYNYDPLGTGAMLGILGLSKLSFRAIFCEFPVMGDKISNFFVGLVR